VPDVKRKGEWGWTQFAAREGVVKAGFQTFQQNGEKGKDMRQEEVDNRPKKKKKGD